MSSKRVRCTPGTCPHPIDHGLENSYTNHGCRCEDCRRAHREYQRAHQSPRCINLSGPCPHLLKHGTLGAYTNHGCRCEKCREVWRRYQRELRGRRQARFRRNRSLAEIRHGSPMAYDHYGCRCRECRLGQARRNREQYVKRKLGT